MTFELAVVGPGLELVRAVGIGQSVLIGRDADCDLCLPDPERTVSRQHLVIWEEEGQLRVRVLSSVNGIDLPSGELAPGGVAVLEMGQIVMVGDYDITVRERASDGLYTAETVPASAGTMPSGAHEDDPFGEWGFDATMVQPHVGGGASAQPGPPQAEAPMLRQRPALADAQASHEAAMSQTQTVPLHDTGLAAEQAAVAFFRGLGLAGTPEGAFLGPVEMEAAGRKLRIALQGLVELYGAKLELARVMGADERTMVATRESNPLRTDWPLDLKLEYLVGLKTGGAAYVQPEIALADLVAELRIHDLASTAASKAVLESALREFEPERLQTRIAADKSQGLMARLRPWEAFSKFYAAESQRMFDWVERLFNRYFIAAYIRESTRIRNESKPRE